MFKHILLPTDGSPASSAAILDCMKFAQETGARVTALHVLPEYHAFTYRPSQLMETRSDYLRDSEAQGAAILSSTAAMARELQVPCDTAQRRADHPHEAILQAARENGCDMIALTPHGSHGLKDWLLGSETEKVLAHTEVPVLVFRPH